MRQKIKKADNATRRIKTMSPKMEVRAKLPVILFDRRRDRHRETESPRIVLYSTVAVAHLNSAGTGELLCD
tara:strand:- start:12553 stop:12765 length:213 start_codon:yes stop_codon:yes gene_type:complete